MAHDGASLRLKGSLLIYQSKVESVDAAAGQVHVQFPTYMCRCDPHFYDGCAATNEALSALWRVQGVRRQGTESWHHARTLQLGPIRGERSGRFRSPAGLTRSAFTDADGDGRDLVLVYDVGPGSVVKITTAVHVTRLPDGRLDVRANVPYQVTP